mmetsp:Transcript_20965/g.50286  ORF Transcript_20965/g.50286 Transcript_20965/m.50286 type:complete len:276 (-) Transcript_20965:452-1279(-)
MMRHSLTLSPQGKPESLSGLEHGFLIRKQLERRRGLGDLKLLLVHVGQNVREEGRGKVPLARVGQHCQDDGALLRLLRRLERRPHRAAAGDAREDAFLLREELRRLDRRGAGDGEQLVHQLGRRVLQDLGDEVGRPPLDRVGLERRVRADGGAVLIAFGGDAGGEEPRVGRLGEHDLHVGPLRLDRLARAVESAAGAVAGHPVVELLALEGVEDLWASRGLVEFPVGLVLELMAEEPAMLGAQLLCLAHHARALPCLGSHDDFRPEHAHQPAALH